MTTRPRFLNSAFVRAPERLVLAGGRSAEIDIPVRYGAFDHPSFGLCLIDTGYTERVMRGSRSLALQLYAGILRPRLLGTDIDPEKVGAILISHLHADHVAGLKDYPRARFFVSGAAIDHFLGGDAFNRVRHGVFRELLPDDFLQRAVRFEGLSPHAAPYGLGDGFDVFGDGEVIAIALPGHMRGHMGFVWPKLSPPLLYAADAQWLARAVMEGRPPGPPARWIMDDVAADAETRRRLRAFADAGGEIVYCHDPEPIA